MADRRQRRPRRLPIGVCLRAIRAEPVWWLESARRLDAAGYAGLWCWDHFMGRGEPTVPVVEAWTILSMAAAQTSRATVGTFVLNVMNRHPALVARMASTLQIASGGRLILGHGDRRRAEGARGVWHGVSRCAGARRPPGGGRGGDPGAVDRRAGDPAIAVLPADRRRRLPGAGSRAADRHRRRDARRARGWPAGSGTAGRRSTTTSSGTCRCTWSRSRRPVGGARTRPSSSGFQGDWLSDESIRDTPWIEAPRETWERWREAGADGAIVLARTTDDVDALVEAAERW